MKSWLLFGMALVLVVSMVLLPFATACGAVAIQDAFEGESGKAMAKGLDASAFVGGFVLAIAAVACFVGGIDSLAKKADEQ